MIDNEHSTLQRSTLQLDLGPYRAIVAPHTFTLEEKLGMTATLLCAAAAALIALMSRRQPRVEPVCVRVRTRR